MTYLIKRHGCNGANQSMTQDMVLGWVDAADDYAARQAAADRWTCYNNQHFSATPFSRTRKADREEADTQAALEDGIVR